MNLVATFAVFLQLAAFITALQSRLRSRTPYFFRKFETASAKIGTVSLRDEVEKRKLMMFRKNDDSDLSRQKFKFALRNNHLRATNDENRSKPEKSAIKIIIAGAPASGKGTQCEFIKNKYGVVHLSTGDILRAAVKQGTELGLKAKEYMDAGQLVPDELIIGVVCDRLGQKDCQECGWLLDGFPRTKAQAEALRAAGIEPDRFLLLDVPEEKLVERVVGRRTDPVTGKIYHLTFNPPENEEIRARLVQRSDDTEEKIKIRYREFQSHIDEVQSYYTDKLVWIPGALPQEVVSRMVAWALDGTEESDFDPITNPNTPWKIIIAGAPASGKGTQCEFIKNKLGVVHLSTGDMLRAAVKQGTELGLKAKEYMDAGQLVPDELIIGVVCDRLGQKDCQECGWLLDGFPRTKAQAEALRAAGIEPNCFLHLDVPEEKLVERVVGRRTDPVTGKIYHLTFNPPENEEIRARLVQRSDDTEEKIKIRYREFQSHIDEVQSYYTDKLVWIPAALPQEAVSLAIQCGLQFNLRQRNNN